MSSVLVIISGCCCGGFAQEYAAVFITTPYIILNSAYDMWQVLNDLEIGCVPSTVCVPLLM